MRLVPWKKQEPEQRSTFPNLTLDEYLSYFTFNGNGYPFTFSYGLGSNREEISASFNGYVQQAYKSNGVVFACMLVRLLMFSEARFKFRQLRSGRPGDLFGNPDLGLLERPWANATTGDLLTRMEQDASLAGNFYATRRGQQVRRLRPDWVTIVLGRRDGKESYDGDLEAELVGYLYHPGGKQSGSDPVVLLREQVAHYAPIPDPAASYRGMSWLTPIIREIEGDGAATRHKAKFFENGATVNLVATLSPDISPTDFEVWVEKFRETHEGVANAYKTLFLGGGADVKTVGSTFEQMEFKVTQGAGETRIAAAAGVPPVIVGLSEGLAAATYSNYQLAMRRFADLTMRPLWRNAAGSLATLVKVPTDAELWYDDRDIPALAENEKDRADIQQVNATTIKTLIDAGYEPDSVISAVTAGDMSRLTHSGLYSVQLQSPGSGTSNGSVPGDALPAAT